MNSRAISLLGFAVAGAICTSCSNLADENPTFTDGSTTVADTADVVAETALPPDVQSDAEALPDGGCILGHGCANNFECSISCAESPGCKWSGLCCAKSLSTTQCVAHSEDDCRKSYDCETDGRCELSRETCAVLADADCRQSWACSGQGRCTAKNGVCFAASDSDCKAIDSCKLEGCCWALNGECQPTTDQDCAASTNCKELGKCVLSKYSDGSGVCVCATDPKKFCYH